jgi:fibronectin-binding autotransporter adhesin
MKRRMLVAALAVLLVAGHGAKPAWAITRIWNVVTGTWNTAANWSPNSAAPNGADVAQFSTAGTFTSTVAAGALAFGDLSVSAGTVTINGGQSLSVTGVGGSNTALVTGPSTILNLGTSGSALSLTTGANLSAVNGGTINVKFGSSCTGVAINDGTAGNGTIVVDGAGSKVTVAAANVGSAGTGNLTFQNNSTGNSIGSVNLAFSPTANSVGNLSVLSGSTLTSSGGLAAGTSGITGQSATITVDGASSITQTGIATITLGAAANSTTALRIGTTTSGASFTTGTGLFTISPTATVSVGTGAITGTLNANGSLTVDGGVLQAASGSLFNFAAGKTLAVQNGGRVTFNAGYTTANSTYNISGMNSKLEALGVGGALAIANGGQVNVSAMGLLSSISYLDVGNGTNGTLSVDGAGSRASATGTLSEWGVGGGTGTVTFSNSANGQFAAIDISTGSVPNSIGIVNVQSGATLTNLGGVDIGGNSATGSFAAFTVTGAGSAVTQTGTSSMIVGTSDVGAVDGTLTLSSGGTWTTGTGSMAINPRGLVDIQSGGTLNANASPFVSGGVLQAANGSAFNLATGKSLTVENAGHVTISIPNHHLTVAGGAQAFIDTGGQVSSTGSIRVGDTTNGTLVVDGAGSQVSASQGLICGNAGGTGTVTFSNSATGQFPGGIIVSNQALDSSSGTVNVQSGATLTNLGSVTIGGNIAGGSGTFTVTGTNSAVTQNAASTLTLGTGDSGTFGTLNITNGGAWTVGSSTNLNFQGLINIDGGFADLKALNLNDGTITFNRGSLSFADGLTIDASGLTIDENNDHLLIAATTVLDSSRSMSVNGTTTIQPFTTFTLAGGTFNTADLVNHGTLNFQSGTLGFIGAGGLTIGGGGPLGSTFTLGAGRNLNVTNTTTINPGSLLLVESGAGFSTGSLANSGEFDLDGLAATANATTVSNSGLIRGEGRIVATAASNAFTNNSTGELRAENGQRIKIIGTNAANSGKINLQGGTAEFTQPLTNGSTGQILGRGTLITGGTGLTNSGNIALSGGLTDVFGDLNNATSSATKGITISGSAGVTFWDDVTNGAGSLFKVSSGSSATFFGAFGGGGISGGGQVNMEADVTPGFSPAAVTFGGNLTFDSTSTLHIDIGGTTPGNGPNNHDQVNVVGAAALGGTLDLVPFNGFAPVAGDKFVVMTYANASGTFATVTGTTPAPGLTYTPVYSPTNLTILTTVTGEKTWAVDSSGNASLGANWTGGVAPSGIGDSATFSTIITAPRVVTFDADTTVGTLKFDSPINYEVAGPHAVTLQATGSNAASIHVVNSHGNGAHTISAPLVLASDLNLVQDSSGTLRLSGSLDNSTSRTISKSGPGTVEITVAPTLGANAAMNLNAGTLRFAASSGSAAIGTGVQVNVNGSATLELSGTVAALASSTHRTAVANSSAALAGLLVSGTNQIVGGIDGSGTTLVNAGSDLSATHIAQSALIIGGTAGNAALVTIDASDAIGNPLLQPSGVALIGSPTTDDTFAPDSVNSANLNGAGPDPTSLSPGSTHVNPSAVPEPATLLLVLLAFAGVIGQRVSRRLRAIRNNF